MVICLIALTDVIFAVDSIPAIFAITSDPFIVLTSNVFAILGLRAMYFLLAAVANKFHLLNYGLAVILVFIGTKMCLIDVFKIPIGVSLGVVVGILAATMLLSVRSSKARPRQIYETPQPLNSAQLRDLGSFQGGGVTVNCNKRWTKGCCTFFSVPMAKKCSFTPSQGPKRCT